MRIGQSKIAILSIFIHLISVNGKTYCWPTRKKILFLLKKIHKIEIAPRTLDHHLRDLCNINLIVSFKRTGRNPDGTMFNLPSNRQVTRKCLFFLKTLGFRIANYLFIWAKEKIIPELNRMSHKINQSYKELESKSEDLSDDLQKWMKKPGLTPEQMKR